MQPSQPSIPRPSSPTGHIPPATSPHSPVESPLFPTSSPDEKAQRAAARTHSIARLAAFQTELRDVSLAEDSRVLRCAKELHEFMGAVDASFAASNAYQSSSWRSALSTGPANVAARASMMRKATGMGIWVYSNLGATLLELAELSPAQRHVVFYFLLEITGLAQAVGSAPTLLDGFKDDSFATNKFADGCDAIRAHCEPLQGEWTELAIMAYQALPADGSKGDAHLNNPHIQFVATLARNIWHAYPASKVRSPVTPQPPHAKTKVLLFLMALAQTISPESKTLRERIPDFAIASILGDVSRESSTLLQHTDIIARFSAKYAELLDTVKAQEVDIAERRASDARAAEEFVVPAEGAPLPAAMQAEVMRIVSERLAAMKAEMEATIEARVAAEVKTRMATMPSTNSLTSSTQVDTLASASPTLLIPSPTAADEFVVLAEAHTPAGLSRDQMKRRGWTGLLTASAASLGAFMIGAAAAPAVAAVAMAGGAGMAGHHAYAKYKKSHPGAADAAAPPPPPKADASY